MPDAAGIRRAGFARLWLPWGAGGASAATTQQEPADILIRRLGAAAGE
jgi:hypothetical protein